MEVSSSRGARGSYSKFICLRCRSRKIKCILTEDSIILPSNQPQPVSKACQRCKQMGLDCVVDSTVLGRPAHKRQRTNGMGSVQGRQATASGDFREGREPAKPQTTDIKKFLLSYSQDSGVAGSSHGQPSPSKLEIYESLRSPVHLLSLLLSRDERFAKSTAIQSSALAQVSASDLITDEVAVMLDQQ